MTGLAGAAQIIGVTAAIAGTVLWIRGKRGTAQRTSRVLWGVAPDRGGAQFGVALRF
jgi:hypothetical protein